MNQYEQDRLCMELKTPFSYVYKLMKVAYINFVRNNSMNFTNENIGNTETRDFFYDYNGNKVLEDCGWNRTHYEDKLYHRLSCKLSLS
jgi:hypothetical protein